MKLDISRPARWHTARHPAGPPGKYALPRNSVGSWRQPARTPARRARPRVMEVFMLGDVSPRHEVLGHEDGSADRAHLGVVGHEEVLPAVGERLVPAQAPHHRGHAVLRVAVEARLGPEGIVVDVDEVTGRRRVSLGGEGGAELAPGALDLRLAGWLGQL